MFDIAFVEQNIDIFCE